MIINMSGGGTGCQMTVTAPALCTVTVSKDGKTKTKVVDSSGVVVFKGLSGGEWTVTITDGEQTAKKTVTITTDYAVLISFNTIPDFTYTGDFEIVNDADEPITVSQDNWKIRFLTSGTLTFTALNGAENGIDVFCVGGGGGGGKGISADNGTHVGCGGGGGYTKTGRKLQVVVDTPYEINIGAGGSATNDGGDTYAIGITVSGGKGGNGSGVAGGAGSGGSGGGGMESLGGSDGSDGEGDLAGKGQISTPGPNSETGNTREFGAQDGKLYSGGGGGSKWYSNLAGGSGGGGGGGAGGNSYTAGNNGRENTGGGGGGSCIGDYNTPGSGGSGIVIIRNTREVA